jgi:uncharacterized protein
MSIGRLPRRRGRWIAIAIVVVFLLAANFLATFYTDFLWFQEVGITSVLWKSLGTQYLVGAIVAVFVAVLLWVNLWVASRSAPVYGPHREQIDHFRDAISPYVRWIRLGIAAFIGIISGVVASASWGTFLLWANRVDFGTRDPQFGRDIGFYFFELPLIDLVLDEMWGALLTALLFSAAAHYIYGAIRPQRGLAGVAPAALAHLSVLLGLVALVKALQYWFGQYQLNFSERGVVTGASYTDVTAQLPALRLLAAISVISAVLFLVNIRMRRLSLPLAAVGIWILTAFLAGGVWPWWVQRFSVDPQELARERRFIDRNISATREGFGLDDVETRSFAASSDLTGDDLGANQDLLDNVRVWDPGLLQEAYQQLQAIRTYYNFPDVDVDRYEVDGRARQVLLSARELSLSDLPTPARNWANLHLRYTHGYGLVASLANSLTSAGQPSFIVKDVPGTVSPEASSLEVGEPRIYYGESFEPFEYSIVFSKQQEIDYPIQNGVEESSYAGNGGVEVGNFLKRLAFAVRETDPNLVLSSLITNDSRILIYRDVRDRVLRAAPFLRLDSDPYITAVDDRLVWVLDAYTMSPWYPYSQRFDLDDIVESGEQSALEGDANYVRNSVKVVVDAYDGTMKFYVIDQEDPLIQAWRKAFPALFTDEEVPEGIEEHFRYPEDLFKLQSEVYLTYHMDEAGAFYSKEDEWEIPDVSGGEDTIATTTTTRVAPTYLLFQLPGESEEEFLLTQSFTPRARNNMISFMVARSDPGDYGQLMNLQFPRQRRVPGPAQVNAAINQDFEIAQNLTLLRQEGSQVAFGSLVTLPIEDSILYIQPVFVRAEGIAIPELKRVVVVFGEEVAMEETFDEALATLFDLEAPQPPAEPQPEPAPGEEPAPTDGGELQEVIAEAGRLYERAQAALADGDFETYGRLIERLGRLLEQAQPAEGAR